MATAQEIVANCACLKARMAARVVTRTYDGAYGPSVCAQPSFLYWSPSQSRAPFRLPPWAKGEEL